MAPLLADGDYVLLQRYDESRRPAPGDVACIARAGSATLVKRLGERCADGRFRLSGDAASSASSADLGLAAEREIVGRARVRICGNRVRLIRTP